MSLVRLDKYLADAKVGTRSEVKKYVKNGRVKINDAICKDSSAKLDTEKDEVFVDGIKLNYEEFHYYMLYKPAGCVSATKDRLSETVLSFLGEDAGKDLFPVGRLDKDTEGLLLISDDGKLAHELLSPRKHVDKTYRAIVTGKLNNEAITQFETGLDIGDDKKTLPAKIEFIDSISKVSILNEHEFINSIPETLELVNGLTTDEGYIYDVSIHEGRFHQIKRMFEAVGEKVIYLKRLSMGNLLLDENLQPGEYRKLTVDELESLKNRQD